MTLLRPPGPEGRWFGFSLLGEMRRRYLDFWQETHRRYGDAVYMRLTSRDLYAFAHPALIREVLVEKAKSFVRYERIIEVHSQLHGRSVLIAEGEEWRQQRRILQPSFSNKQFDYYAGQVVEAARESLDRLPTETSLDFEHAMNMLTIDAVLRTMFGGRVEQDTAEIEKAVRLWSQISFAEMGMPMTLPDWLPLPGKAEKRWAMGVLNDFVTSQIRRRRAEGSKQDDFLGTLLALSGDGRGDGQDSDRQARDQSMAVFLAGHSTTATSLCWAAWVLAKYPDVQERASVEIDEVIGQREPTFADMARLTYLDQVVKETLRLYSPATGVIVRRATEDVQVGEWLVPKGALVSILSFVVQRDERWFEDPLRFDPERFNPENAENITRGSYFPFGIGPRVCIGNNLASMEIKLALALLLQRYSLTPAPGQAEPGLLMHTTMRPAGGMRLVLSRRTSSLNTHVAGSTRTPALSGRCPVHVASGS
ncbi:cytochrome P450 [Variovorax sp. NFACC27]|uniref:cytochrome P450 n=1 Tax=unclassified Variovorax TaxID=663243 RepID=UPI000898F88A|nr:cytochrome P450 [Variovorax sp. YR750]SEF29790.1 Cytochrome P450 [Variovorax sp. NFACC28]SEG86058.1 Cytochrome P450 [Variovorax sp. NFACC29]SFD22871.1 Cytochrome P450 [Variovorax sp. NFACC26]SFG29686.1 Cytochrome P450 [Variovorax sp. NFACC27]SEM52408.1 Cytochrome P450 [Variovorax sp. YR750]